MVQYILALKNLRKNALCVNSSYKEDIKLDKNQYNTHVNNIVFFVCFVLINSIIICVLLLLLYFIMMMFTLYLFV